MSMKSASRRRPFAKQRLEPSVHSNRRSIGEGPTNDSNASAKSRERRDGGRSAGSLLRQLRRCACQLHARFLTPACRRPWPWRNASAARIEALPAADMPMVRSAARCRFSGGNRFDVVHNDGKSPRCSYAIAVRTARPCRRPQSQRRLVLTLELCFDEWCLIHPLALGLFLGVYTLTSQKRLLRLFIRDRLVSFRGQLVSFRDRLVSFRKRRRT